ncbi:MAG TPA: hypothetical protein PLP39_07325 [Flavobacterium lutivivi]|nr:hypothetical protein [Flavobacterium lutivivi]
MELIYENLENNILLETLKNNQTICKSLAYMLTFDIYEKLQVQPMKNSITIFNEKITISIILYVGYENEDLVEFKNIKKLHIVSFSKVTKEMHEFEKISNKIKFIEPKALFFTTLSLSNNDFCNDLKTLLNI